MKNANRPLRRGGGYIKGGGVFKANSAVLNFESQKFIALKTLQVKSYESGG